MENAETRGKGLAGGLWPMFRSELRRRLLVLLFTNPDSSYYTRQLHGMLGGSVGTLHRELTGLEESGVLRSERRGNLRLYSADPGYPLYAETKSIIDKSFGVQASLEGALGKVPGVIVAFVYGSFAAGTAGAASDVDLFVLGDVDQSALHVELDTVERALSREIEVVAMTADDLRQRAVDGSGFLDEVLGGPKLFLVGDDAGLQRFLA